MKKYIFFISMMLTLAGCDKEQQRVDWLNGEWELVGFYELNADATRKSYVTFDGTAVFKTEKKKKEGELQMNFMAIEQFGDTVSFDYLGRFVSDSGAYYIEVDSQQQPLMIEAQTKKDLHLTAKYLTDAPLTDMVFKKKN
ncbi:MAG: membrane lipoprotein lipid attachment site-containing protein [Crocinitomicaceae bacterium]|jgi:hypothetical protein|nr:membrane lipoprotein lipid attachment site-containing protein [Crocinitomicaceae bacterium]